MAFRAAFACVMLLTVLLLATTGCLNLGGRTTYVQETPETKSRLTALETRVGALEQAYQTTATATTMTTAEESP